LYLEGAHPLLRARVKADNITLINFKEKVMAYEKYGSDVIVDTVTQFR
jgi:hypothetical protein